jgi:hypothetical protein
MKLPRFTLRELFLLVVIAAMGCGWWAERFRNRQVNTSTINSMIQDLETEPEMQGVSGVVVGSDGKMFMVDMTRAVP